MAVVPGDPGDAVQIPVHTGEPFPGETGRRAQTGETVVEKALVDLEIAGASGDFPSPPTVIRKRKTGASDWDSRSSSSRPSGCTKPGPARSETQHCALPYPSGNPLPLPCPLRGCRTGRGNRTPAGLRWSCGQPTRRPSRSSGMCSGRRSCTPGGPHHRRCLPGSRRRSRGRSAHYVPAERAWRRFGRCNRGRLRERCRSGCYPVRDRRRRADSRRDGRSDRPKPGSRWRGWAPTGWAGRVR